MYLDALKSPFRFSFSRRTTSRTEAKSLAPTSNGANEAVNLENNSQAAGFKTIDELVRASITNSNGDSEWTVRYNMLMARQWHRTYYRYPHGQVTAAWIIADHLREEHGYDITDTARTTEKP